MKLKTIAVTGNIGSGKGIFVRELYRYLNSSPILTPKVHYFKQFVDDVYSGINSNPSYEESRKEIVKTFGPEVKLKEKDFSEEIIEKRQYLEESRESLSSEAINKKVLKDMLFENPQYFSVVKNILVPAVTQRFKDIRKQDEYFDNNVQILHINFFEYKDIGEKCDYVVLLKSQENFDHLAKGYSKENAQILLKAQSSFEHRKKTIEDILAPHSKLIEIESPDSTQLMNLLNLVSNGFKS